MLLGASRKLLRSQSPRKPPDQLTTSSSLTEKHFPPLYHREAHRLLLRYPATLSYPTMIPFRIRNFPRTIPRSTGTFPSAKSLGTRALGFLKVAPTWPRLAV